MASKVGICNQALNRLGSSSISSFLDGDDKSLTCDLHYELTVQTLMSMNPDWRFCMAKRAISRLSSTPDNVWQYEYQLPSDLLAGPHRVYDSDGVGARPVTGGFEVYGTTVATDFEAVVIDYTYQVLESKFPKWFEMLCVLAVTAALAENVTDQEALAKLYHEAAFGTPQENMRGGYFAVACQINRNLAGQQCLQNNALTSAMHGS